MIKRQLYSGPFTQLLLSCSIDGKDSSLNTHPDPCPPEVKPQPLKTKHTYGHQTTISAHNPLYGTLRTTWERYLSGQTTMLV